MYWERPFKWGNQLRKGFVTWTQSPERVLQDGDQITLEVTLGDFVNTTSAGVSSGGEIYVPSDVSEAIRHYATKHPDGRVGFRLVEFKNRALLPTEQIAVTEREATVLARVGQYRFRTSLNQAWGGMCAVTRVGHGQLLRAAHIERWCDNVADRLNVENGLLLVATLDAAFECGLIGFADDGTVIFNGCEPCEINLQQGDKLHKPPSKAMRGFLAAHRKRHKIIA